MAKGQFCPTDIRPTCHKRKGVTPLIVLLAAFTIFFLLGSTGVVTALAPWPAALRFALLLMFALTASAHFTKSRADLVRMVPPNLPQPELLITLTGILEIAGAIGLLLPASRIPAGIGLVLLLIALFPANAYAAKAGLSMRGRRVLGVVPRGIIQIVFIAAVVFAVF